MDYQAIAQINILAFGRDNEANLVDLLRKSDAFNPELSLVAIAENRIAGHILFTKIKIINAAGNEAESLALAPLAVLPEFQNKGIGSRLVTYGLNKARELQYRSVIVLGHKNYYARFGFEAAVKWNIRSPFKLSDEENFMGIELVGDGLKNAAGFVKYPEPFMAGL